MKAVLKQNTEHLFSPEFKTSIGGQSVRISRADMVRNWPKYIYTPVSSMYRNLTELREKFRTSKGAVGSTKPVVLDMSKANQRGTAFSQPTKKQKTEVAIASFNSRQKRNLERMKERQAKQKQNEKNLIKKAKDAAAKKAKRAAEANK